MTIWRQASIAGPIASRHRRVPIRMAAIFGAEAKKAVTGVGAPS